MLWVVVAGVYLVVLRLTGIDPPDAFVLTVCVAVVFIGHVWWGRKGASIAIIGIAFVVTTSGVSIYSRDALGRIIGYAIFWFIHSLAGFCAYFFGCTLLGLVNWLDSLGRKPSPPDS